MSTQLLLPDGFGYGLGSISRIDRLTARQLSPDDLTIADELLRSEAFFAPVEADDDGCGDGRLTIKTYRRDATKGNTTDAEYRLRAKIFGGGLTAATSMFRAVMGQAHPDGVLADRRLVAEMLKNRTIQFGGHDDDHAHGTVCGCGAIDKYALITENIVRLQPNILGSLETLLGKPAIGAMQPTLNAVFGLYHQLNTQKSYFTDSEGAKTLQLMLRQGAVIKRLGGPHLEVFVVVNMVPRTTFDAMKFDAALKNKGITTPIQVFVVDAWRGDLYAEAVAHYANEVYKKALQQARATAKADFLVRTLATAATLTAGDLPVYVRTAA
ncbi:MAG TPA: cadmium-containing carbonic anhydrase [Verrucomicrobiae bacterium]|nr:cadmium-containing carbonic anhydrase [Verrucomicrobiae bacterium]